MELLLYAVIFSMILIVSNATNKLVPNLPLPLIQILLGIVWALFVPEENFHLDTELFLALVIGPLLFREAEEADITSVLKHWRVILYLIFPVIFISTISFGLGSSLLVAEPSFSSLYGRRGSSRSNRLSSFCFPV